MNFIIHSLLRSVAASATASTSQATISPNVMLAEMPPTITSTNARGPAYSGARSAEPARRTRLPTWTAQAAAAQIKEAEPQPLARYPKWRDTDYRRSYVVAAVEQGLAWQIRANRQSRNLTQEELAQKIGTQQSAISRLEDPTYGAHSLDTLLMLAHAFDCALSVRFTSFSRLAEESADLSPLALVAEPFDSEVRHIPPIEANDVEH